MNMFKRWKVRFLNNLSAVTGGIDQSGNRWLVHALANTSSSRIYLKQAFQEATLLNRGGTFDHHYWWAVLGSVTLCLEDTLTKCATR